MELVKLAHERHMDELVEAEALRRGLLVTTTHSTLDGFVGDEIVLAPAFTSTDDELGEMVSRMAATMRELAA